MPMLACLPATACLPISMTPQISALPACTSWHASGCHLCHLTLTTLVVSIFLCVKFPSLRFPIHVLSRPQRGAIWPLTADAWGLAVQHTGAGAAHADMGRHRQDGALWPAASGGRG